MYLRIIKKKIHYGMRDLGDNAIIYVYTDEFMGSMDGVNGLSGRRVFYLFTLERIQREAKTLLSKL